MNYKEYTVRVYATGAREWLSKGMFHCEDGPAVESADGSKYWYQNGILHRTDGPAIKYANGNKYWYQNGKLHRTDGPAVEFPNGKNLWYIKGIQHTKESFDAINAINQMKTELSCGGKIVEIDGKKYKLMEV